MTDYRSYEASECGTIIIAEAGVNHNGSLEKAKELISAAAEAGADGVKFQTFKAEEVVTSSAPKAVYQKESTGKAGSQLEMIKALELPFSAFSELKEFSDELGISFLSTPFDRASADFLVGLDMAFIKVPSGEITNLPFLTFLAEKGTPLVVSTGMSTLDEVGAAVKTIEKAGNKDITLLHCVSDYPAKASDSNLRAMETMRGAFGYPVGFSDHTLGIEVSLAAAVLGASMIEKHFTLDRTLPGPDHKASIEPHQLTELVKGIRSVESALGDGKKVPVAGEAETAEVVRRSLVAATDINKGTELTLEMISIKRPGTGMAPSMLQSLVGRVVVCDIKAGTLFTPEAVK